MSVVITLEDIEAYAEVDYIINHMNEKYINKVPEKIRNFFSTYKAPNYDIKINPYVPLQKQGLKRYTLEIIALLHLKYWCEDEKRKQELYDIMLDNQEKLEKQMKEKFSIDNMFSNTQESEENQDEIDYSRPRIVQKYEQYTKNNSDIKDYTDYEESNSLVENEKIEEKSFFQKIKEKILEIFKRKSEKQLTKRKKSSNIFMF